MKNSYQGSEEKTAKAFGSNINVSPKHCNEICYKIKNMNADRAIDYLKKVEKKEDFIPFRRYNTGVGHRTKGIPGRYPVKAARIVRKLVENAKSNAEFKGLDASKLKIVHATAYKTITLDRIKPKGRAHSHRIDLASIEIVVREM